MSGDPSLDLQEQIISTLRGDSGVVTLVGQRVYDSVPTVAAFPYVSLGPEQLLSDDVECITAYELSVQIDVWSRATGQPEMKRISGAVRDALHNAELDLDDFGLVLIEHVTTRYLRDPDGATKHAAIEFRALIDTI